MKGPNTKIVAVLEDKTPLANGSLLVTQDEYKDYVDLVLWFHKLWHGGEPAEPVDLIFRNHPLVVEGAGHGTQA